MEVDAARVHYGEIALMNVHGGTSTEAREAFDLIVNRKIDVQPLISDVVPLEQTESALKRMIAGEVVKIAIEPALPSS